MKPELLNQLQQIATGSVYSGSKTNDKDVSKIRETKLKDKLKKIETEIKAMYPNNKTKFFKTWEQATKDFPMPTESFKEFYWNKYLELNPEKTDKVKKDLVNKFVLELNSLETPTQKEHFIRDKISRMPNWLVNEVKDDLQNYSVRNSDTNFNKAKQVYKDDLSKRLNSLADRALDPDVSEEAHINDLLKLEKMNLMDVSEAFNGRFGVVGRDGGFIPAFDLEDRNQVFPNDIYGAPNTDEQLLIDELAPDFIRQYVKGNISNQREKIELDNKASEGVASMMLESGTLTPDKWGEAFSMFSKPEYTTLMKKGLRGELESGRISNSEDMVKSIYMILSQYKDLLGEETNGSNP
jgi:hypothetical protein